MLWRNAWWKFFFRFFFMFFVVPKIASYTTNEMNLRFKKGGDKTRIDSVKCDQAVYTGNVLENAQPGTFILRVSANTLISHSTKMTKATWTISDSSLREFSVDSNTGDISVTNSLFRFGSAKKSRSVIEFRVTAKQKTNRNQICESLVRINIVPMSKQTGPDGDLTGVTSRQVLVGSVYGQPSSVFTGTTSILTFTQNSYQFTVFSCSPGSFVGQITLQSSIANPVTFSILNGNFFYGVNSQTGIISVQNVPPTGTQTLLITGQTTSGQSASVPVSVSSFCNGNGATVANGVVFGDSVAFAQPSYQFSSSACTAGSVIGQVLAQSSGQTVTYSIPAGNTFFAINPTTGLLSTTLAPPGGTWSQTFVVAATTSATGRTTSVTVTITNTCSNPGGFNQPSYSFSLNNCAVGRVVGNVFASAGITGGVAYSIPNGNPYFAIAPATGQITVIQAPPIGLQSFTTQSISSSGQTSTAVVTVNVSAGPPTFPGTFYTFTLTNCIAGASVGQVSATSCGSAVSYSLIGNGNPYYTVNQLTGQISLLNVPPPGTQTLAVQATSSNGQSVTVPVIVTSPCGQYNIIMPYGLPYPYYPQYQSSPPYYYNNNNSGQNYVYENIIPYLKK